MIGGRKGVNSTPFGYSGIMGTVVPPTAKTKCFAMSVLFSPSRSYSSVQERLPPFHLADVTFVEVQIF